MKQILQIQRLLQKLKQHSPETYGHSIRVGLLAEKIARALKLPKDQLDSIKIGGFLHDIGKIKIGKNLLHNKKTFNPRKTKLFIHPEYGYNILKRTINDPLVLACALFHQEFFNGMGYPYGLRGEEIPLGVRIVKVADTWDALVSKRSYKEPISEEKAKKILRHDRGKSLDPKIVDIFLKQIAKK